MEDSDVIREVKEGNTEAFAFLVEKHHRRLLNFIFRIVKDAAVVEDIGQEVFLSAYKSLDHFDERRGTPFSAWLFIAAKNRCISELRSRRLGENVSIDDIAEFRNGEENAAELLVDAEEKAALRSSVRELPEPYRSTILRNLLGDTIEEIAIKEGVSLGTVKSRIFRARKRIKLLLSEYYGGNGYERV